MKFICEIACERLCVCVVGLILIVDSSMPCYIKLSATQEKLFLNFSDFSVLRENKLTWPETLFI